MGLSQRKSAVANIAARKNSPDGAGKDANILEIYGEDVFGLKAMKAYLPKDIHRRLMATIQQGSSLDASIAESVANAMKRWAIDKGASHYTHWFQPLTGSTAEKHDSFIEPDDEGGITMRFSASNLIKGEPDASSFPSGGLRATFEARGYTAWDATSPAFIKRNSNGATLCIPTAFCSYNGEALDKKTPLLRSMQALAEQTKRLIKCFDIATDSRIKTTLGAEQEYFLIDKELYMARPDLIQTGRTLFGNSPAKHQQLDDHYFGSIKRRVLDYMSEVDRQLWILGIPAKTRHNEVAPAQFEIASVFEEVNLAVDHNMIIMEVLRTVADRFNLVCLLHEKPFAGINGSGKHNNWSTGVNGLNFLDPGKNPKENALFLTTLCAVMQAVDKHADLIRISAASAGNDHRLGANEAPPAIISIFLGNELTAILEEIGSESDKKDYNHKPLNIGADILPLVSRDNTDRNRTSPFAFTGNKFEFRAVGSNQSCADANTVINLIMAESFDEIATALEKVKPAQFNSELSKVLAAIIKKHKRIIFNGDNYSDAWKVEAEKRGLPNLTNTPMAIECLKKAENIALFEKYKVCNARELESRYEVFKENYQTTIEIEGDTCIEMAKTMILPAIVSYQGKLAQSVLNLKSLDIDVSTQTTKLQKINKHLASLGKGITQLEKALDDGCAKSIIAAMNATREAADTLESMVDDQSWPLPKYSEMLFIY